jgi:alpha-tubulin suppressor-like RCC1 family protein
MRNPAILLLAAAVAACATDPVDSTEVRVIAIAGGNQQQSPAGLPVPVLPTVLVSTAAGAPLPGVEVLWQVLEGGGRVDAFRAFTDSAGHASVRWTLGDDIGNQLLYASTAGTGGVTFRATSGLFFSAGATGWRHSCGLDPRGLAWCWGGNQWGQLGDGTRTATTASRPVSGRIQFAALYPGMLHTCGLTAAGAAWCWGDNGAGQLGDGTTRPSTVPMPVLGGQRFRSLTLGYIHTCGLTMERELYCWGSNQFGQLGSVVDEECPATGTTCRRLPAIVQLPGVVQSAAAGQDHSCAVTGTERVWCWGDNAWGQLGTGTFGGASSTPAQVASAERFQIIAANSHATCALDASGRAFCWGQNAAGRLGTNSPLNAASPSQVFGGDSFVEIGMSAQHTCARTPAGAVYCWGAVRGDGEAGSSFRPVPVTGGPYTSVSVGGTHACAYRDGIWCWGDNSYGQFGVPADSVRSALAPILVRTAPPTAAR